MNQNANIGPVGPYCSFPPVAANPKMESWVGELQIGEPMNITPADTLSMFLGNLPPGSKVTIEIGGNSK